MSEFGDKPYLTKQERAKFKKMRDGGVVSFFKCGACEECKAEIPAKIKRFCSWECYQKVEAENGQEQDDPWTD